MFCAEIFREPARCIMCS